MTRWVALTVALCLSASVAGADPIPEITISNADFDSLVVNGHPHAIRGGYWDVNQDTAMLFTGHTNETFIIDNTIFFGILASGTRTRIPILYSADGSDPIPALLSAPEPGAALLAAAGVLLLGLRGLLRRRERR